MLLMLHQSYLFFEKEFQFMASVPDDIYCYISL